MTTPPNITGYAAELYEAAARFLETKAAEAAEEQDATAFYRDLATFKDKCKPRQILDMLEQLSRPVTEIPHSPPMTDTHKDQRIERLEGIIRVMFNLSNNPSQYSDVRKQEVLTTAYAEAFGEQPSRQVLSPQPMLVSNGTRPIIFLDLDGVVRLALDDTHKEAGITPDRLETNPRGFFHGGCCDDLRALVSITGAEIVLISTLRTQVPQPQLLEALQESDFPFDALHDLWFAPVTGSRTGNIAAWLQIHGKQNTQWIVLDDEGRHYDSWQHQDRVLLVSGRYGLQPTTAQKAAIMLGSNQAQPTFQSTDDTTL